MDTTTLKDRSNGYVSNLKNGSVVNHLPTSRKPGKPAAVASMIGRDAHLPSELLQLGLIKEVLQWAIVSIFFFSSAASIHIGQWVGTPLYFINKKAYDDWMAFTKQAGALLVLSITQWWSPIIARVSGDESVKGQLTLGPSGFLECGFDKRAVLIANHQIYTDWSYLWWVGYTAGVHGQLYIMLKESIKWIPILGIGLQFFGFIFMSRKWSSDEARMTHRLQKLNNTHSAGKKDRDPMWLLVFPEGTNLSAKQRSLSAQYAAKSGQIDMVHTILPRSTGLRCCLQGVKETVDWLYDCTIAYEGIGHGQYSAETFTIRGTYFQGRQPRSVNMYWRRFKISEIPVDDQDAFNNWVMARWREKDQLIENFINTGRFTADAKEIECHPNGVPGIVIAKAASRLTLESMNKKALLSAQNIGFLYDLYCRSRWPDVHRDDVVGVLPSISWKAL